MKYKRDYTTKTADEWFSLKKWTGFLMRLQVGRTVDKECNNIRDLLAIRAVAATLSSAPIEDCPYKYSVTTNTENALKIYVKASKK